MVFIQFETFFHFLSWLACLGLRRHGKLTQTRDLRTDGSDLSFQHWC